MESWRSARRALVKHFISVEECKELEFIHKSCGVMGYRPYVFSTTLSHLVATNCAGLIIPLLSVRERVKEMLEEYFGREYELFTEFTGLISWTRGAKIGWHTDNNRPYLQQRHYSAVCYLNNYECDFKGGLFHFQCGEPETVIPSAGDVLVYAVDEGNMHCVDKTHGYYITEGERCTLALWFTLDQVYDEDTKIIQQLSSVVSSSNPWFSQQYSNQADMSSSQLEVCHYHDDPTEKVVEDQPSARSKSQLPAIKILVSPKASNLIESELPQEQLLPSTSQSLTLEMLKSLLPFSASSNMYMVLLSKEDPEIDDTEKEVSIVSERIGFEMDLNKDLRLTRLESVGFQCCFSINSDFKPGDQGVQYTESKQDHTDFLNSPLELKWKNRKLPYVFASSLHALQVSWNELCSSSMGAKANRSKLVCYFFPKPTCDLKVERNTLVAIAQKALQQILSIT